MYNINDSIFIFCYRNKKYLQFILITIFKVLLLMIIVLYIILEQLHKDWDLLLAKLAEKGVKLQQALVLVQFLRQCDEVMFWINDKVSLFFKFVKIVI